LLGLVVGELNRRKVLVPVVLEGVDVGAKHVLDGAVGALGLTVGLRVSGGAHVQLGPGQRSELSPELGGETRVPVADKLQRQTVVAEHVVQEQQSDALSAHS
jgi:hypothetical protein